MMIMMMRTRIEAIRKITILIKVTMMMTMFNDGDSGFKNDDDDDGKT